MMTHVPTHYDNLKVAQNAPIEVIRAAYRVLARMYHPDVNSAPDAQRVMSLINEARRVLADPVLRAAHDAWIANQRVDARQARQMTIQQSASGPGAAGRGAHSPARRWHRLDAARAIAGKTLYVAIALALLGGQTWLHSGAPSRFDQAVADHVEDASTPATAHHMKSMGDRYAQAESVAAERARLTFEELAAPGAAERAAAQDPVTRHARGGQASTAPTRQPSGGADARPRTSTSPVGSTH